MKKITVAAALILQSTMSFAAQSVKKDYGTFDNWKVQEIKDHSLWKKDACIAFSKSDKKGTVIELYAQKLTSGKDGEYVEPTIQVQLKGYPSVVRAVLTNSDGDQKFDMTLAAASDTQTGANFVARLGDRKEIIDFLKSTANIRLKIINTKNTVINVVYFPAGGFKKAFDKMKASCAIENVTDL